jgi:hypothetical protein
MDMANNKIHTTHSHKQTKKPIHNKNSRFTKPQKLTYNEKIDKFDNWLVINWINIPTKVDKMDIIGKKDGINRNG